MTNAKLQTILRAAKKQGITLARSGAYKGITLNIRASWIIQKDGVSVQTGTFLYTKKEAAEYIEKNLLKAGLS